MATQDTGTVKWFDPVKGFGFIVKDTEQPGPDLFVHFTDVQVVRAGVRNLHDGEKVVFEHVKTVRGDKAVLVSPVSVAGNAK